MYFQSNALARGNACLNCRKKKQKCDGVKPVCHPCEKSGRDCIYDEATKSRQPPTGASINDRQSNHPHSSSTSSSGSSSTSGVSPGSRTRSGTALGATSGSSRGGSPAQRSGTAVPGTAGIVWYTDNPPPHPAFTQDIDPKMSSSLIETFLQNQDKCLLEMHTARFIASCTLPAADPRAPHPAFVQSILLLGCYFSRSPSLANYELRFLSQARREMTASLQSADRLHDFVRASNLVAFYYFSKGMYPEGAQQITTSVQQAITCGLHQIPTSVWRPPSRGEVPGQLMPHSRDAIELGERINTFWQTACLEKLLTVVAGQSAQLATGPASPDPMLAVCTPFPRLIREYENGRVSDAENLSVNELYNPATQYRRPRCLAGLRGQGFSLVGFATHLSQITPSPQIRGALDAAIQAFCIGLPPLYHQGEFGEVSPSPGVATINPRLVLIHTLPQVASLILHQHGADSISRQRCGAATQAMTAIIRELQEQDWGELFVGLGYLWFFVCEILITIFNASHGATKEQVRRDAEVVMRAVRKLSLIYPPLGFQLQTLQRMLQPGAA